LKGTTKEINYNEVKNSGVNDLGKKYIHTLPKRRASNTYSVFCCEYSIGYFHSNFAASRLRTPLARAAIIKFST
jgi:hypothetical protein